MKKQTLCVTQIEKISQNRDILGLTDFVSFRFHLSQLLSHLNVQCHSIDDRHQATIRSQIVGQT
jgi:hypothetical protein